MDYGRIVAGIGIFCISGMLAFKGNVQEALYLALPTVAFFVGEKNGTASVGNAKSSA